MMARARKFRLRTDERMQQIVDNGIALQAIAGSAEANRYLVANGVDGKILKRVLYMRIARPHATTAQFQ